MSQSRAYSDSFTGDGSGNIYKVNEPTGNANIEPVGFVMTGTWNSATITLHLCTNTGTSPLTFAAVPDAAYTADTGDKWDIPTNCYFKLVASGSGSPIPALSATVRGDISKV